MSALDNKLKEIAAEGRKKGFDQSPKDRITDGSDTSDGSNGRASESETTAQKLMNIISSIQFFQDSSGTAWAKVDGNCYPVRSTSFKRRLQRIYYQRHGKTPYSQALQDVLDQATGIALFDSPVNDINVRVAKDGDIIIVDRFDGQIKIMPLRWKSIESSKANFWQPQGFELFTNAKRPR